MAKNIRGKVIIKKYPVDEFINAKIWNDKTFWQVEQDIEWVDDDAS